MANRIFKSYLARFVFLAAAIAAAALIISYRFIIKRDLELFRSNSTRIN